MKKVLQRTLVALLVLQALYLASPSSVQAQEMTCPDHTTVLIDIKPGETPNRINLSSRGVVPVAVLTTDSFDASLFTPDMAHLGDSGMEMSCADAKEIRWNYDDVNGDGQLDLVLFFRTRDLHLTSSSTEAMLMAHGMYGSTEIHIMGLDTVRVKP